MEDMTVEDMVRALLMQAIVEGLVRRPAKGSYGSAGISPSDRTAGDMTGTANLLASYLERAQRGQS